MDPKRVNGATKPINTAWFPRLTAPEVEAILPANRWNFDEFGLMEGQGLNGLVVGSSATSSMQRKVPGSRSWTSFIECISATGQYLPPTAIFKGVNVQQQWLLIEKEDLDHWQFVATENGWINNVVMLEWLKTNFIPRTQPNDPTQRRLLIMDGHGSHKTADFMKVCCENNIHCVWLPPYSSHVLQPLDLAVFSPLKQAYRNLFNENTTLTDNSVANKQKMLICLIQARKAAMTRRNITSGWRGTGLWPVNIDKPLNNRLLFENANKPTDNKDLTIEDLYSRSPTPSPPPIRPFEVVFSTPRSAKDIREMRRIAGQYPHDSSTQRQLWRKIEKSLDLYIAQVATLQYIRAAQTSQIEALQPSRRRRVEPDPNALFVNTQQIHRAQIEVGRIEEDMVEQSDHEPNDSQGSCIVVRG